MEIPFFYFLQNVLQPDADSQAQNELIGFVRVNEDLVSAKQRVFKPLLYFNYNIGATAVKFLLEPQR